MEEINGKTALIVGYGREGKSAHAWLTRNRPDVSVDIADRNPGLTYHMLPHPGRVYSGEEYLAHLARYDTVIRSPGVSPFLGELVSYQKQGGHITTPTNIFFSRADARIVGVTGTKGKSTTASLIAHIAAGMHDDVRLAGNIGTPALDILQNLNKDTIVVLELSSHQLEDIRYSPQVAVMLNIVPEHLDYYPDFETYRQAKAAIVAHQTPDDAVVYNPGHHAVTTLLEGYIGQRWTYAFSPVPEVSVYIQHGMIMYFRQGATEPDPVIAVSALPMAGNRENILAAVRAAAGLGVPVSVMKERLGTFRPLPHRLEYAGKYRGITFVDDSLSTVPEATIHALDALSPRVHTLIAGGLNRGISYASLGTALPDSSVKALILFPDTGQRILEAIPPGARDRFIVRNAKTMEEAVAAAYAVTPPGTTCLLSPASASFNAFADYADRGGQFKTWAKSLGSAPEK